MNLITRVLYLLVRLMAKENIGEAGSWLTVNGQRYLVQVNVQKSLTPKQ